MAGSVITSHKIAVAFENLAGVKSFILLHFLFHYVPHDLRVEMITGSFTGHMALFGVVEQGLAGQFLITSLDA